MNIKSRKIVEILFISFPPHPPLPSPIVSPVKIIYSLVFNDEIPGEKKRNKWTFRKAKSSFKEISNLIGQVLFELLWGIWTELCWVKCYKGIRITMNTDEEVLILELLYKLSFTNRNELSIFFIFFRFRSSELGTFSQKVFFFCLFVWHDNSLLVTLGWWS